MYEAILYLLLVAGSVCFLTPLVRYFNDPLDLRKYPAANILAAITPLWLVKETWNQKRSTTIHRLHQKLGPIVRISPDQLVFNDPKAIPEIYGHLQARKFEKDVFYDNLSAGGLHDIVTSRNHDEHSRKRRYLANSFAHKTVVDMEPVIRENFQRLLHRIDDALGPMNIRLWLNYFTLDVIGDMAYGSPLGFLEQGHDRFMAVTADDHVYSVKSTIDTLHRGTRFSVTLAQFLSTATVLTWRLVLSCANFAYILPNPKDADDFTNIARYQLQKRLDIGEPGRSSRDFMSGILSTKGGEKRDISRAELVAESVVFLNAGSDTTAAALTNTLYYLLTNPQCLSTLRREIDQLVHDGDDGILPHASVRDLPYLRACIDESLRLRPPIAYPLQRVVTAPEGATVLGHHLRKGTVVAVPPFSVHRHGIFPDAEAFVPDRWLDPSQLQDLKAYTIPFSTGPRACLGRHIAIVELQILIATLVWSPIPALCMWFSDVDSVSSVRQKGMIHNVTGMR
ncbi:hypothetical protein PV08_03717 [Exophiala spinifera]|uniref:Benzoate 4-monooxygenase n=1 Tax=Exophiala spinifera TaxID=91928 RepID=A0A0D2A3F3_9EURO|nr:uncharacterized protein PV08_03717 [Exophiala spinifera]KIW19422.1 hypothetical protein PV08_03717 [Exophiala spinifera]